jgi:hypothetical protein
MTGVLFVIYKNDDMLLLWLIWFSSHDNSVHDSKTRRTWLDLTSEVRFRSWWADFLVQNHVEIHVENFKNFKIPLHSANNKTGSIKNVHTTDYS